MEANTKQQQLTYEKGVTNLPSDAICSDNALQKEENLIFRDGEHHVIQTPVVKQWSNYNLLFVHKTAEGDNYIYDSGSLLYNGTTDIPGSGHSSNISPQQVTAIGNTLILAYDDDIHRYLYHNGSYTHLAHIPEPQVTFYLDEPSFRLGYNYRSNRQSSDDIISENRIVQGAQEKYNNMVTGLYALNKKEIAQQGGFCEPFMACVAIELYDGSYTLITNPVLLFPSISMNSYAENENHIFTLRTRFSKLYCSQQQDYGAYSDIVKDVVLFVTDGIPIYDVSANQPFNEYAEGDNTTDGIVYVDSRSQLVFTHANSSSLSQRTQWDVLVKQRESDIVNALEGTAVFYRLCSLGVNHTGTINTATKIDKYTLENIISQPQLTSLDYYSRSPLSATFLYAYNNRLLMSGVTRGFFEGFDFFLPYDAEGDGSSYTFYVTIQTPSGQRVVSHNMTTKQYQGTFFYYPDPRASHVVIMKGQSCVLDADLKEHPFLNGAYYLRGLPGIVPETIVSGSAPSTNTTPESLENYILSSEVNNPFVFPAAGYTRIGNGRILGMAALTQALSQGQFGQYPLLAFTTEGIWAVSIDATGRFAATHPMSREVALENNPAITPVDGAIFFLSKKGLMVVSGNQVRCVSQQLSGKFTGHDFQAFFASCIIAYDYRDSLLWLFNSRSQFTEQCLVYSIASATFAYANLNSVQRAVPNYPDYLIQSGTDIYSFLSRDNPNDDGNTYSATIVTRPLKLENALALKTITQLRHIGQFNAGQASVLTLRIFASNNLNDWTELHSLRGQPWKYYQFQYDFTNLKATDTFAGSVLITQERRTDKLR